MEYALVIGIVGMLCILAAFFLEEFTRHTRKESLEYNFLNLAGAALLAYYAWALRSWPFLILNVVWFLVALFTTAKLVSKRRVRGGAGVEHEDI
jgi:type II secretory pathway pseudopilin PulG